MPTRAANKLALSFGVEIDTVHDDRIHTAVTAVTIAGCRRLKTTKGLSVWVHELYEIYRNTLEVLLDYLLIGKLNAFSIFIKKKENVLSVRCY